VDWVGISYLLISTDAKDKALEEEKKQEELEEDFKKIPNDLPPSVILQKDLPGIKAGAIFELTKDGYYAFDAKAGYAAYDWLTVSNLTDWFRPINQEDLGRWFD